MSGNDEKPVDHGRVEHRRGLRISLVWLFPVLAAAATAWLFWTDWKSNGPLIEVEFETAPGIDVGRTPLIYRGVVAGKVTSVRLDGDLAGVVVSVRLKEFAAGLAREGTVFWIEQPVVGLGDTSGLDALIQGNSLQARIGDGPPATHFVGRDHAPLTQLESPALVLKLRAPNIPLLDRGTSLFHRGIAVGAVESKEFDKNGQPFLTAVVKKEFSGIVRSNSRFWPVPGTSVKIGPGGVKLDLLGLKAILLGGIEFDTFGEPGEPVLDETEFTLLADEVAARASGAPVRISFRDGQGLHAGVTLVNHRGLPVGFVESVALSGTQQSVDAIVRFQPAYDHLHNDGAVFTLIRPKISLEGISGLETIVTGPYIDCAPGPAGGAVAWAFEGRTHADEDLLVAEAEGEGIHLSLQADVLPSVGENAPVLHRGVVAGRVIGRTIDAAGRPSLDVVIRKNFVNAVARNARFWQVPATSVQAGPGVLDIDISSLRALVEGAVAFDVFGPREPVVENGAKFPLFATESLARATSAPVRIGFENGQGLFAGRTQVRYRGLPVGIVEAVNAKPGGVEAVVRFDAGYDFLRREGSSFSIVRLDVSLNGVSGLETVLSGVYIDCVPSEDGALLDRFTGVSLVKAEAAAAEEKGFEIVVTADRTKIEAGAPVSYRGVAVGKVVRKTLARDGRHVGLVVAIDAPYAGLIRDNTKFWDASGLKLSLGFVYLKVPGGSLESLARGGLAFATPDDLGARVERGHEFELNPAPRREWQRWQPELPVGN